MMRKRVRYFARNHLSDFVVVHFHLRLARFLAGFLRFATSQPVFDLQNFGVTHPLHSSNDGCSATGAGFGRLKTL
jgi:hypothetical protein